MSINFSLTVYSNIPCLGQFFDKDDFFRALLKRKLRLNFYHTKLIPCSLQVACDNDRK